MGSLRTGMKIAVGLMLPVVLFVTLMSVGNILGDFFDRMNESSASTSMDQPKAPSEVTSPESPDSEENVEDQDPLHMADHVVKGSIRPGETFSHALSRVRLKRSVSKTLIEGFSTMVDFRRCQPGDSFSVAFDNKGTLLGSIYQRGPFEIYCLRSDPSSGEGFRVYREKVEVERRVVRLSGQIQSSLFVAFSKAGAGNKITVAFCDIFASRIDFNTETWPGDRFDVLYEEYFRDGEFIGYGKILAARYEGHLLDLEAYYYRPEDTEIGAYFDPQGQELGTSFLRSPLPVYRVTSTFTKRRLHPILKVYRPHYGVDLAGPVGTPVMAAADGRVVFAGWKRGFGRIVILRHPGGIQTYYGHLYRFGKGIKKGVKVTQKRIIGYVGASGLATGPHLDYRIKVNGRFRNPFCIKFKPKSRLEGTAYEKFQEVYRRWAPFLHQGPDKGEILVETERLNDLPEGWIG